MLHVADEGPYTHVFISTGGNDALHARYAVAEVQFCVSRCVVHPTAIHCFGTMFRALCFIVEICPFRGRGPLTTERNAVRVPRRLRCNDKFCSQQNTECTYWTVRTVSTQARSEGY